MKFSLDTGNRSFVTAGRLMFLIMVSFLLSGCQRQAETGQGIKSESGPISSPSSAEFAEAHHPDPNEKPKKTADEIRANYASLPIRARYRASMHETMANELEKNGYLEESEKARREIMVMPDERGKFSERFFSYGRIGEMYVKAKQPKKAYTIYEEMYHEAKLDSNKLFENVALTQLMKLAKELGDEEAEKKWKEAFSSSVRS